ncbi:Rne/Rng family ribonuclease [bacterium]|nr:Rne/Rng family ribonuclease [bacterium]
MQKKVIINRGDCDVRVAFLEDNKLVEFHRESLTTKSIVGNIYRGIVRDVVPGLQAAFVDIGLERNVFLHFMDIRPESLVMLEEDLDEALQEASKKVFPGRIVSKGRRPRPDPKNPNAEAPVKKGDVIAVQVVKDGISDKAPRVSTNLAIAGRYVVLLPFPGQSGGVSRRIALGQERFKLKKLLHSLKSEQFSLIMRTAGLGADEEDISDDVDMLRDGWDAIVQRFRSLSNPGLVHSDHDIIPRLVRDAFRPDIDEIHVDDAEYSEELRDTLSRQLRKLVDKVEHYDDPEPIFERFLIEHQLQKALNRKVWLKSGGYLIIEETEALTAIDVNSGRFTGTKDLEKTALRTNMEACEAIAQQIRLRDIGGIIVIDFIDMMSRDNQSKVCDEFATAMKPDRAKSTVGRIGDFGLMMLTRKRKYQSLQKQVFDACPYCRGEGHVLRLDEVWRRMKNDLLLMMNEADKYSAVVVSCETSMAERLQGEFAPYLSEVMNGRGVEIILRADTRLHREDYQLTGVERPSHPAVALPEMRVHEQETVTASIPYEEKPEPSLPRRERKQDKPSQEEIRRRDKKEYEKSVEQTKDLERRAREEQKQRKKDEPREEPTAEEPKAESSEQDQQQESRSRRKRTRRGKRGGRRRQEQEGQQAEQSGEETSEQSEEKAKEAPAESATPAVQGRRQRPPRPPRGEQKAQESKSDEPKAADTPKPPAEATPRKSGIQIVSSWGSSKPSEARAQEKPAPKPAPSPEAEEQPKRKGIEIVGSWGSKSRHEAEKEAPKPAAEAKSEEPTKAEEQKPKRRGRGRRRGRKEEAPTTATAPPEPTPEPAKPEAEKKPARRRARKSAKKAAAAAEEKSTAPAQVAEETKAAKKATKKSAAKKAAKKSAKKAAKKAAKTAAKKSVKKSAAKKTVKKAAAKKATKKSSAKKAAKKAAKTKKE